MRQGAAVEIDAASTRDHEGMRQHDGCVDWQTVDRALRTIARRRAVLDAEEARWLREAEACQIWHPLGMVSALDYMERVLGYGPRAAQERLRVARALGTLPQLTAALTNGELPFSAVRELTRVATPATEAAWRDTAMGKSLRQIEELVADHRPGDHPDDPADPEARTHVVRFELSAETFALLRQTRTVLDGEHGSHLSDDQLVATLCGSVLDGVPATEPTGRARFQIAVTVCERCRQGWQEGAGARIAISPAAVERATCDAQHIGSIDGATPERAHQDISPSVARFVWRRDGGRCRIPGCRSARGLELHHLVHRIDGGSHDASNVVLACSSCHQAHHAGKLIICGTAEQLEVRRPAQSRALADRRAHVGAVIHVNAPDAITHANAKPDTITHTNARPEVGTETIAHANARPDVITHANTSPGSGTEAIAHANARSAARPGTITHVDAITNPRPDARTDTITHTTATPGAGTDTRPEASAANCKLEAAVLRAQTKEALIGLGWKPAIASAAAASALAALGTATTLDRLIFDALRRCARPPG